VELAANWPIAVLAEYRWVADTASFLANGLPFGVQLMMHRQEDRELDATGALLERALSSGMGLARTPLPLPLPPPAQPAPGYVRLAVVGAHLRGLALHHELIRARARLVRRTRTESSYRLYALPSTTPKKPGLVRVTTGGAAIELELYDLPVADFGAFVARIPAPLGIGTVVCEDGERVQGFLCESHATENAEDITHYGGFRAYLSAHGAG
jgi:allophanate hydrolase